MAKEKKGVGIKPLGDRVVVKPSDSKTEKVGSLYVPDSAQEKPMQGKIVALGTGGLKKDGTVIPFEVKVGDTILYSKYGGTDVKIKGEEYLVMRESDILAIVS
jgi:chaperonin GroES